MAPPKRDDNRDTWRDSDEPSWVDEIILGVAIFAVVCGLVGVVWLAFGGAS